MTRRGRSPRPPRRRCVRCGGETYTWAVDPVHCPSCKRTTRPDRVELAGMARERRAIDGQLTIEDAIASAPKTGPGYEIPY